MAHVGQFQNMPRCAEGAVVPGNSHRLASEIGPATWLTVGSRCGAPTGEAGATTRSSPKFTGTVTRSASWP
jgi:hypothetical protein